MNITIIHVAINFLPLFLSYQDEEYDDGKMETEVFSFHPCSLFCLLSSLISGFLHFHLLSCPSSHSSYHPILSSWLYSLSSSFFLIFLSVHCNYDDPSMTTKVHFLSFDLCSSLFDFFSTDLLGRFFLLPRDETIKHSVHIDMHIGVYLMEKNVIGMEGHPGKE